MKRTHLVTGLLFSVLLANTQTGILPEIELQPFSAGFSNPVGIEHAGDSRLFIVEQTGMIRIVDADGQPLSTFMDLSGKIQAGGFEQGVLGLTFDPGYAENGFFYVHYTNLEGNNRFSRFSVDPQNPDLALPDSEVIFLEDDDPFENHNSGQMAFGPDGYLYFALGDGGSADDPMNNAQDITTIMGKLMRVAPNQDGSYSIPPDNPYVGVGGAREEIWATGLRNPWRFSFDRETGDLWIPDVGQNFWEEVNYAPASSTGGENYGWSCREGLHFFKSDCDDNGASYTDPVAEYAHNEDTIFDCSGSITGGYVYRGDEFPNMYGKYFYADFCTGHIYTTYWNGSQWISADFGEFTPFAYSTFGEDINGSLYLADKTSGAIYRFTDGGSSTALDQQDSVNNALHIFSISPNPNKGDFILRFQEHRNVDYQIDMLDFTGKIVWRESRNAITGYNEWSFNSPGLSAGYYILRLQTPEGITAVHLMVE